MYVRKYISDRHVGPALCYALAWRHVLGLSFIGPNVAAAFGPFASCLRLQLSAKPFWATWSGCQTKRKGNKNNGRQFTLSPDRTRPGTQNQNQNQNQKQTRVPAMPAPVSSAAAALVPWQELEQAIYSYAATWLTKSTSGCRSQYPSKGSCDFVVSLTERIPRIYVDVYVIFWRAESMQTYCTASYTAD